MPAAGAASHFSKGSDGGPRGDVENEDYAAILARFDTGAVAVLDHSGWPAAAVAVTWADEMPQVVDGLVAEVRRTATVLQSRFATLCTVDEALARAQAAALPGVRA